MTDWPGSLWVAEVERPAPASDQVTDTYTRAWAVRIIESESPFHLFGSHGEAVAHVLDRASTVSLADLHTVPPPLGDAQQAYQRAWDKWFTQDGYPVSVYPTSGDSLPICASGDERSPVGSGLTLLFNVLHKRARALEGDAAFLVDADGETCFVEKWDRAATVLLYAAMAQGAPELLSETDRTRLLAAWTDWPAPA